MKCKRCGSHALENAEPLPDDVLSRYLGAIHATKPRSVTSVNLILEAFLSAIGAMSPEQRLATMTELGERICVFCGTPDTDCPCWLEKDEERVQ
jgi:hypothetical protein